MAPATIRAQQKRGEKQPGQDPFRAQQGLRPGCSHGGGHIPGLAPSEAKPRPHLVSRHGSDSIPPSRNRTEGGSGAALEGTRPRAAGGGSLRGSLLHALLRPRSQLLHQLQQQQQKREEQKASPPLAATPDERMRRPSQLSLSGTVVHELRKRGTGNVRTTTRVA
uniref:Uncharacterized protein n=1 Tax=Sphaerodactylus townsendi TaxID=933632 RepID=A0ACB8F689_9SAUR